MTKKDRLKAMISHYSNGKKGAFAEYIGVAASTISTWLDRDTYDYELLFEKCRGISAEWLITGDGNMLKTIQDGANAPTSMALIGLLQEKDKQINKLQDENSQLVDIIRENERRRTEYQLRKIGYESHETCLSPVTSREEKAVEKIESFPSRMNQLNLDGTSSEKNE